MCGASETTRGAGGWAVAGAAAARARVRARQAPCNRCRRRWPGTGVPAFMSSVPEREADEHVRAGHVVALDAAVVFVEHVVPAHLYAGVAVQRVRGREVGDAV